MPSPYRWVIVALGLVAFLQTHLHRLGFAPLIPEFTAELGLTYAAAGTVQAAYFWTYMLVQLPVGIAADRWGPRRVMVGCMATLAVGALAFAAARRYPGAIAARMLVGVGAAAVWVPSVRLVGEWFPPAERGRAAGLVGAGGALGGTLGLLVIPWLAAAWGWRRAYGAMAVPALLTLVLIAVLLRPRAAAAGRSAGWAGVRRVLAVRAIWPFNLTVLFAYGGYFSFLTFLPAFLVARLGLTPTRAGLVAALITAGTIVSWPLAGALSDRVGRRKPFYAASQLASVAICLVFAFVVPATGAAGAMVVSVLAGFLVGGLILPFVMITELVPPDLSGTAAGIVNTSCFVGAMVLPIALGRVVDVTGSFAAAFVVAAGVQGLALVCAAAMRETGSAARRLRGSTPEC
jgi:nitrate/nitrite transporter NarK